jgi:RNA polymerase sigma-70 factor, ECF subfamily
VGALLVLKPRRLEIDEPAQPPSDATLVSLACAGDRVAREALFRKHVRSAWTLALRLTARRDEADDVVQEAFVTALADLPKLKSGEAFGAWLATIVVRQAHRYFRRRRLRRLFGLDRGAEEGVMEALAATDASPEHMAELGQVDAALRTIDERARGAWVLRYVEGHSLGEVAEACGCSLATAKRRISVAEEALAILRQADGEGALRSAHSVKEAADGER